MCDKVICNLINASTCAGDIAKSQTAFYEYYEGYGWFGTLSQISPGLGYKVKTSAGGQAVFL